MKKNKETTMTETETIIDLTPGKPIETGTQEATAVVKSPALHPRPSCLASGT